MMIAVPKLIPVLLLLALAAGCAPVPIRAIDTGIAATGTALSKIGAFAESADASAKEAEAHADAVSQPYIKMAREDLAQLKAQIGIAGKGISDEQAASQRLAKEKDAAIAAEAAAKATKGYRLGALANQLFWLLMSLTVIHFVAWLLSILFMTFWPIPFAATICGWIAKITNVPGWTIAALAWFEKRLLVKSIAANLPPAS